MTSQVHTKCLELTVLSSSVWKLDSKITAHTEINRKTKTTKQKSEIDSSLIVGRNSTNFSL